MCNLFCVDNPGCLSRKCLVRAAGFFWIVLLAGFLAKVTPAQSNVVTYRYDVSRSGLNPNEATLTPGNVNSKQFGKLFSQSVDGQVFTQPLYVQNVAIPVKGNHNVVFVATENDSVYAFDADSNTGGNANPLWKVSVIDTAHGAASGATPVSATLYNCNSINPIFGVTGTPTIDVPSGTMYLEAMSMENGSVVHRLHALDITTGAEKSPGPKLVAPSVPGSGDGSVGGNITFNPATQYNKMALLLLGGTLYISYGSPCDTSPYHGWLLAYDTSNFTLKAVYNTTPNGGKGGIWMTGGGLAADSSGNLYFTTGNGSYDGITSFADSVMKVGPFSNSTFPLLDWFTPFDQAALDSQDLDQSAGGVLLLPDQPAGSPHQHLLVTGGKDGTIYLLDRDNLGHFNSSNNSQVVQSLTKAIPALFSTPTWWNNNVYVGGAGTTSGTSDNLRAFKFDPTTGLLSGVSTSQSPEIFKFPAPNTTVSSNGTTNAIVWAVATGQYNTGGSGNLHAYDATNLAHELYNTSQNKTRDNPGPAVKFAVPTVINGKVYVGMEQLNVYGELNPVSTAPIITSANNTAFSVGVAGNFTVTATGTPAPTFSETGALPSGVTFSASGVLSGTPSGGTAGNYLITITAMNGVLPNATQNFTLTINTSGGGGIGLIQENAAEGASVNSVSVAFPTTNTAGNLILVFVRMSSTSQTVTVTDSAGNTYVEAVAQVQTLGTSQGHLFYAKNIKGGIANTVKATFSSTNSHSWLAVYEFKGLSTTSPLDQTASAQGNSSTPSSGATPTTTSANELVFGGMVVPAAYSGTQTVGSGYTLLLQDTANSHASNESKLVTSTGSYTATFTLSNGTYWAAIVATFKP